jgi:DNA polymerase V
VTKTDPGCLRDGAHRACIAIDLKSFYASVECVKRGLDPLNTNLVVADIARTEKTICLAVTPSLKAFGVPSRPRLFEVTEKVRLINAGRLARLRKLPGHPKTFTGKSRFADELESHPEYELDYIIATPHMADYMKMSARIYQIYLKYIAPEDIHVYSVDEVLIDATAYLRTYRTTARALATGMIRDVVRETGITATAGIGTNLYLAKVAMDILAKRSPADENGVRIAELDEMTYRRELWEHRPLTDFWRIGRGTARRLKKNGLTTMGDIARCSLGRPDEFYNEDLLYRLFGINAELLIDHAWGWEPVQISDIKAYRPKKTSVGQGQVLHRPYPADQARLVTREMADWLAMELFRRHQVTDQVSLLIGYDRANLDPGSRRAARCRGGVTLDHYGRLVPEPVHGSVRLCRYTSSPREITDALTVLFDHIDDPDLLVRRIYVSAESVLPEEEGLRKNTFRQLSLFTDFSPGSAVPDRENARAREQRLQRALQAIRDRYGNNAVFRGSDLIEGATTRERGNEIGGHRA